LHYADEEVLIFSVLPTTSPCAHFLPSTLKCRVIMSANANAEYHREGWLKPRLIHMHQAHATNMVSITDPTVSILRRHLGPSIEARSNAIKQATSPWTHKPQSGSRTAYDGTDFMSRAIHMSLWQGERNYKGLSESWKSRPVGFRCCTFAVCWRKRQHSTKKILDRQPTFICSIHTVMLFCTEWRSTPPMRRGEGAGHHLNKPLGADSTPIEIA
jgi:hypothetical protein